MTGNNILDVWAKAPPFTAQDDQGREISLADFLGSMVILFFYPHDGAPGCTTQALGFRKQHSRFQELGAVVIGISPDSVASHARFKEEHRLPFILINDDNHLIASAFGVWGKRRIRGEDFRGVIRSHFLIGEAGDVLHIRRQVGASESARIVLESLRIQKEG
jgi:thioredoxin-dependent peroxiredoxin